jgi:hypothetical protein
LRQAGAAIGEVGATRFKVGGITPRKNKSPAARRAFDFYKPLEPHEREQQNDRDDDDRRKEIALLRHERTRVPVVYRPRGR